MSYNQSTLSMGIELSTQSVKLALLDIETGQTAYCGKFDYDTVFSKYNTSGGILNSDDPKIKHTSPFMLIESIDKAFEKLINEKIDLSSIGAVKVDGMQHCTIYTNKEFGNRIKNLNTSKSLLEQLSNTITRKTSPIWEDRSPVTECRFLAETLAKKGGISKITGNRAELRFPAGQIMKWALASPEEFIETRNIFLLSAFATSILTGKIVPVDTGDGWGTNLNSLDINHPGWSNNAIYAAETYIKKQDLTGLRNKLNDIIHYDTPVGHINKYFSEKFGVNPDAVVLAGTGDNPATLLGCGGNIVISLGSSYTINGVMNDIKVSESGEYNIFGYTKGKAMSLTCFTNGGKVHEFFARKYINGLGEKTITINDWNKYIRLAGDHNLEKDEKLLLPFLIDESVPLCRSGIIRDGFSENIPEINIRALHISFAISMKLHSRHLNKVDSLCIVGGGSKNSFLRHIITDVFNATSYTIKNPGFAAPIGCAISGARELLNISYKEAGRRFVAKDKASILQPNQENQDSIKNIIKRYSELEKNHLKTNQY